MTKKTMIRVHNDERPKELGFRLLIPVHDELIGEWSNENKGIMQKISCRRYDRCGKEGCMCTHEM